ncbi:MAG: HAD hydrolase-like protein [Chlorobi bacterium]|nr:HAD hydrolase-like protein [Chlorobiota bacterium]
MKDEILLIDLDGVLRIDKNPAPGLAYFFDKLRRLEIPFAVLSNSTLYGSREVREFFVKNGIPYDFPIITAVEAAARYVKENYETAAVFVNERVRYLFDDVKYSETPQAVVVGDLGKSWNFEIVNSIFKMLLAGADLIALQKNKYWKTPEDGILIDAGAFIAGLEYAADKEAILVGKPSPLYFQSGIKAAGGNDAGKFIMLGDDLASDIAGAKNAGGKTTLIMTGKTNDEMLAVSGIEPDFIASDLIHAAETLEKIFG